MEHFDLNTEQVYAEYELENWWNKSVEQVFEISGAAGTGKTTLVRYMIERLNIPLEDVLFVAYMGKAAMQMARHGLPAKTMHSAMYTHERRVARDSDKKIIMLPSGKPKMEYVFLLKDQLPQNIKLIVIDEGSMVSEKFALDILSFNLPVIVLGDLNQLPPVFGNPYFLKNPNVILKKIMRQAEDNPIIYLSQQAINGIPLKYGVYGNSSVITKDALKNNQMLFTQADIILTGTNKLRSAVNKLFREVFQGYTKLDVPHVGEKVICRKNNWNISIDDNIYLTNGLSGFIEHVDMESLNGKTINIDFRPDFLENKKFKNLSIDYDHLNKSPDMVITEEAYDAKFRNKFEYAYAITTHLSQGSQWDNILLMYEKLGFSSEDNKKLLYTGITRAAERITIAI